VYIKINITFRFVAKFIQIQNEKKLFSDSSELIFHPLAASTQIDAANHNTLPNQQITENIKHPETNHTINLADSTINDSVNGIASSQLLSMMESTLNETSKTKKRNKTNGNESITKENVDRLNRMNFFLKNIPTSNTYFHAFVSIVNMYPLTQSCITDHLQKIQYLCVAGNSFLFEILYF